ncbi:MAG TPA: hypothetical protein VFL65_04815 [Jatrophihabitans sp.]|nr:hypothetical protein [Jatrophihabitans sp.]
MRIDPRRVRPPQPESLGLQLAAGRAVMGAAILAFPVPAARLLGADTATARRVSWMTRMLAVRDGALGVGGAIATRRGTGTAAAGWLLAGAVSDATDALVYAAALRQGRLRGAVPTLIVPGAALAAAVGAVAAAGLRRRG